MSSNFGFGLCESTEWLDLHCKAKLRHRRNTSKSFDIRPGDRILDICYGSGSWTEIYLNRIRHNGKIVGIDPLISSIKMAKERYPQQDYPSVSFYNDSTKQLHELDGKFDAIILGNTIGYFNNPEVLIIKLKKFR